MATIMNSMDEMARGNSSMDNLTPARVYQALTIAFTIFYSILFLSAFLQLWLVLFLRHKLISTQSTYFFLCCLFTSLRIVLFSFFFRNISNKEIFSKFSYWILMCLPGVVQYLIVLLITVFYYKTYIKSKGESSTLSRYIWLMISIVIVLQTGLSLIPIWFRGCLNTPSQPANRIAIVSTHVLLTDLIFLATISTFVYVYKQFPKFPNAILVQEAKKITKTRSIIVSSACLIGVLGKLLYDITALFGCSKIFNITLPNTFLQSDFVTLNHNMWTYVIFGTILFFWEIIPLVAAMVLFRMNFPTGFFKKRLHGASSRSTLISNSRSRSTSMASSFTGQSRFIRIPYYGSTNSFINSSGPSSGFSVTGTYNRAAPRIIKTISPLVNHSYNPGKLYSTKDKSSASTENCSIQNENPKVIDAKRKTTNPAFPRIWRSTSVRYLERCTSKERVNDPKLNSSRLATAREE